MVTQKLFDSITLARRNLEVPRRQIDLGYNELEEANYNPDIKGENVATIAIVIVI